MKRVRGDHSEEDENVDESVVEGAQPVSVPEENVIPIEGEERPQPPPDLFHVPLTDLESLMAHVKANPSDLEARERLIQIIRRVYLNQGGMPITPTDPVPVDLSTMTHSQLAFIIENMNIHVNRTQRQQVVDRILSCFTTSIKLLIGKRTPLHVIEFIESDHLLKDAITFMAVGSLKNLHPWKVVTFSFINYALNLYQGWRESCDNIPIHFVSDTGRRKVIIPPPTNADSSNHVTVSAQLPSTQ